MANWCPTCCPLCTTTPLQESLAPYITRTLSEDEWDEARERAWGEATENEDAPRP